MSTGSNPTPVLAVSGSSDTRASPAMSSVSPNGEIWFESPASITGDPGITWKSFAPASANIGSATINANPSEPVPEPPSRFPQPSKQLESVAMMDPFWAKIAVAADAGRKVVPPRDHGTPTRRATPVGGGRAKRDAAPSGDGAAVTPTGFEPVFLG